MRTAAPALLPILRSRVQGDLLALVYLHPEQEYSLTEAARAIHASVKAVQIEASRLVEGGFLVDSRRGNVRLLRPDLTSPVAGPLTELLLVTFGPRWVLTDVLSDRAGVEAAYIHGSWAARYAGGPGPIPGDVDVLVIGTADLDDLDDAAREAQDALHRPVDVRRVRPETWAAPGADPFLVEVRRRPLLQLDLAPTVEAL